MKYLKIYNRTISNKNSSNVVKLLIAYLLKKTYFAVMSSDIANDCIGFSCQLFLKSSQKVNLLPFIVFFPVSNDCRSFSQFSRPVGQLNVFLSIPMIF